MSIQSGFIKRANQKVFVYRNLHQGRGPGNYVYSLRGVSSGRVQDRKSSFILENVSMRVGQKGRQRVIDEGRKNVHAGLVGVVSKKKPKLEWQKLLYDPKKQSTFTDSEGNPAHTAQFAKFTREGVFIPKVM